MKNIFVFVATIILLTGCKLKLESTKIKELENAYPDCEIRKIPDPSNYDTWLVKTPSNKIIYVYFDLVNNIVSHSMY